MPTKYQNATSVEIDEFLASEGLNCLGPDASEDDNQCQEPYFSWQGCDVCSNGLGADVEDCSGYNPTTKEVQGPYRVCPTCLCYLANGDRPEDEE